LACGEVLRKGGFLSSEGRKRQKLVLINQSARRLRGGSAVGEGGGPLSWSFGSKKEKQNAQKKKKKEKHPSSKEGKPKKG